MRRTLIVVAALVVVGLYFSGRLDRTLYKVGLNYTQCGQNGFGAVFCGDQLTAYNDHLQQVQDDAKAAGDKIKQDLQKAQQDAQAQSQQILEQSRQTQTQLLNQICATSPTLPQCSGQ